MGRQFPFGSFVQVYRVCSCNTHGLMRRNVLCTDSAVHSFSIEPYWTGLYALCDLQRKTRQQRRREGRVVILLLWQARAKNLLCILLLSLLSETSRKRFNTLDNHKEASSPLDGRVKIVEREGYGPWTEALFAWEPARDN